MNTMKNATAVVTRTTSVKKIHNSRPVTDEEYIFYGLKVYTKTGNKLSGSKETCEMYCLPNLTTQTAWKTSFEAQGLRVELFSETGDEGWENYEE